MRESVIEKYLVDRAKEVGAEVRKVKWIGRKSCPDRYWMHWQKRCWIELKASGKDLEPAQWREIIRMREMGEEVKVFNSIDAIDSWIVEWWYA